MRYEGISYHSKEIQGNINIRLEYPRLLLLLKRPCIILGTAMTLMAPLLGGILWFRFQIHNVSLSKMLQHFRLL